MNLFEWLIEELSCKSDNLNNNLFNSLTDRYNKSIEKSTHLRMMKYIIDKDYEDPDHLIEEFVK